MGFERILLDDGLLTAAALDQAHKLAGPSRQSLAATLIEHGFLAEADVLRAQARQFGMEFVTIADMQVERAAVRAVTSKLSAHYGVMPLRLREGVLTLAVSDPLDLSAVEDIEATLGYRVERALACRDDIRRALAVYYGVGADTVERLLAQTETSPTPAPAVEETEEAGKTASDTSVVRLVNQFLQEAIRDRATDIHFEAERDGVRVRRRIDGVLCRTHVHGDMRLLFPSIISRVKLMAGLDIVERRLPQDGRAGITVDGRRYDLRVSVVPAMHGEDVVVRILPASMLFDLGDLGYDDQALDMLCRAIARPTGILLVTGPTGSGKSTTLYACLSRLNSQERKIITIEDPVEYELRGITQTQIHPRIGLTFAHALRSMLRHDPDVMMVGEIRDLETARIAVQSAMTGHLVLSTLHTNDAASTPGRLTEMGVEPYLVASTLALTIAQRLVRLICSACRERHDKPEGESGYRGRGCRACHRTGYRGRAAINEMLPNTGAIQDLILEKAPSSRLRSAADALGMRTLAQDGAAKAARGLTTMEEVMRVTAS